MSLPPIVLVFTSNDDQFSVKLSTVAIDIAEEMGLGFFSNLSAITNSSRAIEGSYCSLIIFLKSKKFYVKIALNIKLGL